MNNAGFRSVKVVEDSTGDTLDRHGAYIFIEVSSATDTKFYPNGLAVEGTDMHTGNPGNNGIPIKAGETRRIPMAVYNFKADAPVTVVAYRM